MTLLDHLDAFGMDDPANREGQPEDRCNICDRPVIDHPWDWPPSVRAGWFPARWPHRWHALLTILGGGRA